MPDDTVSTQILLTALVGAALFVAWLKIFVRGPFLAPGKRATARRGSRTI